MSYKSSVLEIKSILRYIIKEVIALVMLIPSLLYLKFKFSNQKVLFVLNYHNFSKYNNYRVKRGNMLETGFSKNFEKQMKFFKKYFNFSYPEEFFGGESKNGIHILITFDDGYKDNFDIAYPILKNFKIPTIFFVTIKYLNSNDYIMHDKIKYLVLKNLIPKSYLNILKDINSGKNFRKKDIEEIEDIFLRNFPKQRLMLNFNEVLELKKNEFKIGNHTYGHDVLSFMKKEDQSETIKVTNDNLKDLLGVTPKHIAYPNGLFNSDTLDILDEININYAYTTIGGYNKVNDSKKELKRIGINASDSKYLLLLKLVVYSTFKYGKSN